MLTPACATIGATTLRDRRRSHAKPAPATAVSATVAPMLAGRPPTRFASPAPAGLVS